jgi:LuxR family transcriptional regulator, maltose regulon positive regulatory protein
LRPIRLRAGVQVVIAIRADPPLPLARMRARRYGGDPSPRTAFDRQQAAELMPDPFIEQLVTAALEVRAARDGTSKPGRVFVEPLTVAEQRVLALLPTSTYLQIADILYISRNTVKTHLRSIYRKLGVASRSKALQRAADLRLL